MRRYVTEARAGSGWCQCRCRCQTHPLGEEGEVDFGKASFVACQRDGTSSLLRVWDHLGLSVSMARLVVEVNASGSAGQVSLPVGRAFDDQDVCCWGEPVNGGLGQEWLAHHGELLGGFAVGGADGRGFAVAFDDDFVEVAGLGGVEWAEREVVEDEQFNAG